MFCSGKKGNYKLKKRSVIVSKQLKYDDDVLKNFIKIPKTKEDEELITKAIEQNEFLCHVLTGTRLKNVIDTMYNQEVSEGELIVEEGSQGSHLYISAKGSYEIILHGEVVNVFQDVRVFGELAILYNSRRHATIRANGDGKLWVLDCTLFKQIMVRSAIEEQKELVSFLSNVPKLNSVRPDVLKHVAGLLKPEFYSTDTAIVREGERGDKFYIVRAGAVSIHKKNAGKLGQLKKGSFFGELALIREEFRQATVKAEAPGVECLTLSREHFINHFGKVEEFHKIKLEEKPNKPLQEITEYTDLIWTDLKIVKTIGVGGFGRVELVKHNSKPDLVFALKYMKKVDIVRNEQQNHVQNEKKLQMSCNSPFIVRLYRTYSDAKYIYFLQECCLGGDLFGLLDKQKNKYFDETSVKFYSACALEGLSYLHGMGIIYRDLKPENAVIDSYGYVKLTDFGLCRTLDQEDKAFTFVGTPEYLSPELILNKGYDKSLDIWSFGIFIFELLTGKTPFRSNDRAHLKTYKCILKGIDNVKFPSHVTSNGKNIVKKLCRNNATDRLGCQKGGFSDIRKHAWFSTLKWNALAERNLKAPFIPNLKSNIDTSCFEDFGVNKEQSPPDELSGWDEGF